MNERTRAMSDTKERILDTAQRQFAERGFAGASLRAITAEAHVNLAAVNYHFHSKEELIRALFARCLEPVNRRRLEMLSDLEEAAAGKPVPLERLAEAFIGPVLEIKGPGGPPVLLGRVYSEPGDLAVRMMKEQMAEVVERFVPAFHRALPRLPLVELSWRLHFVIGAMVHTLGAGKLLEFLSGGLCDTTDVEGIKRRLVAFAAAGLRGPLPRPAKSARRAK